MQVAIRLLNAIIMIALPLALAPIFVRRLGVAWRLFAIGALTFLASQALHIPFNLWALNPLLERLRSNGIQPALALVGSAVLVGLSAGVFEELSRYLVLRFALRHERGWGDMLMFGLGHGGIEAILLGMLALYSFFQALALRQADLTTLVPPDQLQSTISGLTFYWEAPWHMALLGALERAMALCLHLGLTALVWKAVVQRSLAWVGLAILGHALANAITLIIFNLWGAYAAEGFLALAAGFGLLVLFAFRRQAPPGAPIRPPRRPQPTIEIERLGAREDLDTSKLDESRFLN